MRSPLRIAGLGGSFRTSSSSARILEMALRLLSDRGHETTSLFLSDLRLPGYETFDRLDNYPDSVHLMLKRVREADALILSTPVYHGTISGGMKNAIDFLEYLAEDQPPYLTGKVIGLMCTSGGAAGVNAINTMDYICRALHGWVCPTTVVVSHSRRHFDEKGELTNELIQNRIAQLATELEFAATRFKIV